MVAAVAFAASIAGIGNQFAQDDLHLIEENVRIHDLGNWRELLASPFWPSPFSQDLYRPLTSILLAVEHAFGLGDPLVFRVVSYLLYAAVCVAVFVLTARLVPSNLAFGAALLFAAHPVHVEAVALGVGQSELVVALLAVTMARLYLDRRRTGGLAFRDWAILGALYIAASLFKEHGLVLPGLLIAVEFFLVRRQPAGAAESLSPAPGSSRQLVTGFAFLAILGALVLALRWVVLGGEIAGTFTAEALAGLNALERALTMLRVVPEWTRLLLWPAHLRADYSPQELTASTGFGAREALGLLILSAVVIAAWLGRRRAPVFSFGIAWIAIALLPVSNVLIPTGILLGERTLFLPSLGFVIAVAGLVVAIWPRMSATGVISTRGMAVGCGVLVVAGVMRSAERHRVWRHDAFLAVRSVQDAPRSFRTQRAYGDVLFDLDRQSLALEAYRRAIALAPAGQTWRVRNDLARRFRQRGEFASEAEQLAMSLAEMPSQEDTRGYLISAYLALGKYAEAARAADSALARGAPPGVFRRLRELADSAASANAPPGSIKIGITTGMSRPVRP